VAEFKNRGQGRAAGYRLSQRFIGGDPNIVIVIAVYCINAADRLLSRILPHTKAAQKRRETGVRLWTEE
jgi:hypothetical protein